MRLIDADALKKEAYPFTCAVGTEYAVTLRRINEAPTIDAEPVRHGRWGTYHITGYDGLHPTYTVPCSECAYEATFTYRYCPNCGARMDAETKDALNLIWRGSTNQRIIDVQKSLEKGEGVEYDH